jgi:hypothetical protein
MSGNGPVRSKQLKPKMQSCPNSPVLHLAPEGIPAVRKAPIEADVNLGEATD